MLGTGGAPKLATVLNMNTVRTLQMVPPSYPILVALNGQNELDAAIRAAAPYGDRNLHYVVVDQPGDTGALMIAAGIDLGLSVPTPTVPGAAPATGWLFDSRKRLRNYINPERYDVANPIRHT